MISRDEFKVLMAKHGVDNDAEVSAAFDAINQDGTGMIKYSEFVAAALDEATYTSVRMGLHASVCSLRTSLPDAALGSAYR